MLIIVMVVIGSAIIFNQKKSSDIILDPITKTYPVDEEIEVMVKPEVTLMENELEPEVFAASGFTLDQIALHSSEEDCYTIIRGIVYDITAYFREHPGGDKNILRICGIDGTSAFNKEHGTKKKPNNVLADFEIGTLEN